MKREAYTFKRKITLFFFILLTFYVLRFTFYLDKAEASALSLGINPPLLQIEAQPPADIKTPITIQNLGDDPVTLGILFRPFTASHTNNGEVSYIPRKEYKPVDPDIFEKIQIRENDHAIDHMLLAPGQQKTVQLHIGIPKNEPFSDYYFSIVFISESSINSTNNASFAVGGISTNVLLTIGTKGEAKGIIEEFSAPSVLETGPVPFTIRVKNTAAKVLTPTGTIMIKNIFGQTVGRVDLLPVNILAGTTRVIPDASSIKSEIRNPKSETPQAYWNESFLLGPYTATLTLSLSQNGPIYIKSVHFVGFPLQALVGIVLSLLFIMLIRNRLKATHLK